MNIGLIRPEDIIFFISISVFAQVIYFVFLRKKDIGVYLGAWLGITAFITGGTFSLAFGFAIELFFWIGYFVSMAGICLIFYSVFNLKSKFLPKWMNTIIYHPNRLANG